MEELKILMEEEESGNAYAVHGGRIVNYEDGAVGRWCDDSVRASHAWSKEQEEDDEENAGERAKLD